MTWIHASCSTRSNVVLLFLILLTLPFTVTSVSSAAAPVDGSSQANQQPPGDQPKALPATSPHPFQGPTTPIVAAVIINKEQKGDIFVELDDNGEVYFREADLVNLKLIYAEARTVHIRSEKYAPMSALSGVSAYFDEKRLAIVIRGKTAEKQHTVIELYPLQSHPKDVYYPLETSIFLNYGLNYAYTDPFGFQSFTAANKLGARVEDVFLVSDSFYKTTPTRDEFVRLASNVTYERRNDLQWLVIGDQLTYSGPTGSSVNIGGIGFSKLYKLDPYLNTQPMFNFQGSAAFPSQARIFMDGVLVGTQPIAPGSFDLNNIYANTGAHNLEVVLTDPFGNEQKIAYPLYSSQMLLREGLHEYSYNVGFLREQYGIKSNEYGKPVVSAFHRYGISSSLNLGARVEGGDGIYNGGVSTSLQLPSVGALTLSIAGSESNGMTGIGGLLQHSYQSGNFSTNLLLRTLSRDYAMLGSRASTDDKAKYELNLAVGYSLANLGGIALNYSENAKYNGLKTSMTSVSYTKGLFASSNLFITASVTNTTETTYSLLVGLNYSFDKNHRGSVQYNRTGSSSSETVQMQKDQPIGEGLGYQASVNRTDSDIYSSTSFSPSLQYNAKYGIYGVNAGIQDNGTTSKFYNASAAGAIVYSGGLYGLSRPVSDSFGIVLVDRLPGVAVVNNGSDIGMTGSSGMMVVPNLTSYNQNLISINSKDVPMDYSITKVKTKISPSLWSGSCIAFDAVKIRALAGQVYLLKNGKKAPLEYLDLAIKIGDRELTFPTGKGGEFYIENILPETQAAEGVDQQSCRDIMERRRTGGNVIQPGTYLATVVHEGGKCTFPITFPATDDVLTNAGEIQCVIDHAELTVLPLRK